MIKQYSIDINLKTKNGLLVDVDEKGLEQALKNLNLDVLGISWRATWVDNTEYEKGLPPTSSD